MKLFGAVSFCIFAAALHIASGADFVNKVWHPILLKNMLHASVLGGDLRETYFKKSELFFYGLQKMCMSYSKYPAVAQTEHMYCKPIGDRTLEDIAEECYKKISSRFFFSEAQLNYPDSVKEMVKDIYNSAVLHKLKTQRERTKFLVEIYMKKTVENDEKENRPGCAVDQLLEDFKEDVTLSDEEAEKAANALADRLIVLMKKLGLKQKANSQPIYS